jgi:hypothetical protein
MKQVHQHDAYGNPGHRAHYLSNGYIDLAMFSVRAKRPEGIAEMPQDGRFVEGFIRDPSGTRGDLSQVGWLTEAVG